MFQAKYMFLDWGYYQWDLFGAIFVYEDNSVVYDDIYKSFA